MTHLDSSRLDDIHPAKKSDDLQLLCSVPSVNISPLSDEETTPAKAPPRDEPVRRLVCSGDQQEVAKGDGLHHGKEIYQQLQ
jgi:hypothetical protein